MAEIIDLAAVRNARCIDRAVADGCSCPACTAAREKSGFAQDFLDLFATPDEFKKPQQLTTKGNEMTEEEIEAPMTEQEKAIQKCMREMCGEPNPIIRNTGRTKNGRIVFEKIAPAPYWAKLTR
jgi:hypothetical protein